MNIGTQTNSLVNHLYSRAVIGEPAPFVGMGATLLSWTDRNPGTITRVALSDSKAFSAELDVTEDSVRVVSGSTHDGSAVWATVPNPEGWVRTFRKDRKTGQWYSVVLNRDSGRFVKVRGGQGLRIGERETYVDPSF